MVVEGDSAPLTLSPSGHFLSPAVAPASILLPFIEAHQDSAARLLLSHAFLRREMEEEVARCKRLFSLEALTKDDSIQLDQVHGYIAVLRSNAVLSNATVSQPHAYYSMFLNRISSGCHPTVGQDQVIKTPDHSLSLLLGSE